jgi:hypothetical protein
VVTAAAAAPALADGDPASDVLPTMDVYLPLSAPQADKAGTLASAVAQVYSDGDRVKVAVIATVADMGAIPSLFNKPGPYARFLGQELGGFYAGPLLIVMPRGYGIYDGSRSTARAGTVLDGLAAPGGTPDALIRSAATAVERLQAASALESPDVKPPYVYPDVIAVRPGTPAKLTFRVLDDSEHASAAITITAGGTTVATLTSGTLAAVFTKRQSLTWTVPKTMPTKAVKLCLRATDPAGNRSAPVCVPIRVKKA